MADRRCSVPNCEHERKSFGYCPKHVVHFKRYGDPLIGEFRDYRSLSTEQRFWSYVQKTSDCWTWTGPMRSKTSSYGRFQINGKKIAAHRFAYELLVGPIPEGMHLDHICHNPPCVNPAHLRPVTSKQNQENQSGVRSDNTSGFRGVIRDKRSGLWSGHVQHAGKRYRTGAFPTAESAHVAVLAKRIELFTHNDEDRQSPESS